MKATMMTKVRAYLARRRALGFQLKCEGQQLQNFARYADELGHRGPLTNQLAIGWACQPQGVDRLYWARRLEIVRTFAQHLVISEPRTQIPPRHLFGPAHRRPSPHLYSAAQVQQLLRQAQRLKGELWPHTWQTLIGLLYCVVLFYHTERNHQGKGNVILFPVPADRISESIGEVPKRERLGGLLEFYSGKQHKGFDHTGVAFDFPFERVGLAVDRSTRMTASSVGGRIQNGGTIITPNAYPLAIARRRGISVKVTVRRRHP